MVTEEGLEDYVLELWRRGRENGEAIDYPDRVVACMMCDCDVELEKFVWPDNEYSDARFALVVKAVGSTRGLK